MNAPRLALLATVERGGHAESWHHGGVAVALPDGTLVARAGDPGLRTFFRSSAKPFQALSVVLSGAAARYAFDDADFALVCASHSGAPQHVARARSLLDRGGFGVDDLECGVHPPLDPAIAAELVARGEKPTPLHNNCSGKHAGMLLACRELGFATRGYVAAGHPLQRLNGARVAAFCGVDETDLGLGVDGCSVPTFHLSLAAMATGWARLADPAAGGMDATVGAAASRILAGMASAPEMVAGPGRFTTRIAELTGGRLVGKEGAEGVYTVAVRGPVAMGVALKIADGGERVRDAVTLAVLGQLGVLSGEELAALADAREPRLFNHAGREVGAIVAEVELDET